LLDEEVVRGKGRPEGALGKASKALAPVLASNGVSDKY